MKLFHVHRDPDWQERGLWRYFTCKCGARRISRATLNLMGPAEPGWDHLLRDSHGVPLNDSGWVGVSS